MTLERGARLGPYEVVGAIGAGGMGEVYRAHDTRLDRDVAIKLLPDAFARDPERVARFQREAKVLASLNHPNIAAIYGLEETRTGPSGAGHALVMELVEGPTLADRISGRPMPVDDVRAIAKQIAAALEVAHEQGIVHRDLKPANVKVRDDGTVKVLDFGLAKMLDTSSSSGVDLTSSPTITSPAMTERGIILGTAVYMSPEQARGRPVDKRADIWSFGAVLYEMLTGRRAFDGEDASDTLANILKLEPKYDAVPVAWRSLVRRCLTKDPKKRLRDIGDAALEIDALGDSGGVPGSDDVITPRSIRVWRTVGLAAIAGLVTVVVSVALNWPTNPSSASPASASFDVALPPEMGLMMVGKTLAISPDGTALAYLAERQGAVELYRRDLTSAEDDPIRGAGDPRGGGLTFSPDSQKLLFVSEGRLVAIPARGGNVEPICPSPSGSVAWLDAATVLFSAGGIVQTPTTNCAPERLTTIDASGLSSHRWPESVAGSNMVLFTEIQVARGTPKIMAVDRTTRQTHEVADGTFARFAPPGWLLFVRRRQDGGTAQLLVAPFDSVTARLTGAPAVLADQVGLDNIGGAQYAVSTNGTLVYAPSIQPVVRILGPTGDVQASFPVGPEADMIAVSPDGSRAVVSLESRIDVVDLERGVSDRVSADPGQYKFPAWLPDGRRISYRFQARGQTSYEVVILDLARGTREAVTTVPSDPEAGGISTWTSDARTAFGNYLGPNGSHDVFRLFLDGLRQLEPIIATSAVEANARLSPDGRLLAFVGTYGGQYDAFVQPVSGGERVRVSTAGAVDPNWTRDGRALVYRLGNRIFSSAITTTGGRISAGAPRFVAERPLHGRLWSYGIKPDGRLVTLERAAPVSTIRVVQNWPRLLRKDLTP